MPAFDVMAKLCKKAGASMDWVAWDEGKAPLPKPKRRSLGPVDMERLLPEPASQSQSQPLRYEELTMAFQLLEEVLEGKSLPPAKRAELVSLIYEGIVDGLPEAKVLRWARAAI